MNCCPGNGGRSLRPWRRSRPDPCTSTRSPASGPSTASPKTSARTSTSSSTSPFRNGARGRPHLGAQLRRRKPHGLHRRRRRQPRRSTGKRSCARSADLGLERHPPRPMPDGYFATAKGLEGYSRPRSRPRLRPLERPSRLLRGAKDKVDGRWGGRLVIEDSALPLPGHFPTGARVRLESDLIGPRSPDLISPRAEYAPIRSCSVSGMSR